MRYYLGLGANLGNRRTQLQQAIAALGQIGTVAAVAGLYTSSPVGYLEQPWFYNTVVALDTPLDPHRLLESVQHIEHALGRTPGVRFGPRLIDIDILLGSDTVVADEQLQIPHPRMHERRFVVVPLADIAPDAKHPLLQKTVALLRHELDTAAPEQLLELVARDWTDIAPGERD